MGKTISEDFVEDFEEDFPIGLLERRGAVYRQGELLHQGKKGAFYSCTIFMYEYQYKAIAYIANNGERSIYDFTQLLSLHGQEIPCKNISGHVLKVLAMHQQENASITNDFGYFIVSFITSLFIVMIPVLLLGGTIYLIAFLAVKRAFACYELCFVLWIARCCLVKFRRAYYN